MLRWLPPVPPPSRPHPRPPQTIRPASQRLSPSDARHPGFIRACLPFKQNGPLFVSASRVVLLVCFSQFSSSFLYSNQVCLLADICTCHVNFSLLPVFLLHFFTAPYFSRLGVCPSFLLSHIFITSTPISPFSELLFILSTTLFSIKLPF